MEKYEPHEFAERSPEMTADEFAELKADIADNGLIYAIVIYEGRILDGRHRYRACIELGIEPRLEFFNGTREEADERERGLNEHRRHLSVMARREWIRRLRDKGMSTRAIAEQVGVSKGTVGNDLKEAGAQDWAPEPDPEPEPCETNPTPADSLAGSSRAAVPESKPVKVKGLDGKTYSANKPKAKAKAKPEEPGPTMTAEQWGEFFIRMSEVQKFTAAITKRNIPKEMKSWELVQQLEQAARKILQAVHRLRSD